MDVFLTLVWFLAGATAGGGLTWLRMVGAVARDRRSC
jgi:hypothetical protein